MHLAEMIVVKVISTISTNENEIHITAQSKSLWLFSNIIAYCRVFPDYGTFGRYVCLSTALHGSSVGSKPEDKSFNS